jgi:hypothetical protein
MVGGHGPTWPRWLAPPRHRSTPHVALPHHWSMGGTPQVLSTLDPTSVSFKGWDEGALDPWVHRHTLGGVQPTSKPPYCPNKRLTCQSNHLWGATKALRRWIQGPIDAPRRPQHPRGALTSLGYLQVPPPSLHTIKGGVELSGEVPHTHSSISSFFQALWVRVALE